MNIICCLRFRCVIILLVFIIIIVLYINTGSQRITRKKILSSSIYCHSSIDTDIGYYIRLHTPHISFGAVKFRKFLISEMRHPSDRTGRDSSTASPSDGTGVTFDCMKDRTGSAFELSISDRLSTLSTSSLNY
jgi:hypothetical protein